MSSPIKRVLVTGAGGYIGTVLVPLLLESGYEVVAFDRFFFGRDLLPDHDRLRVIPGDNRRMGADLFEGVQAVIDLAALSNDPSGELFQAATWEINHQARVRTAELAKAAGVSRYVLPSSCSIYGWQPDDVKASETTPTNPLTTYAKANEKAEHGVLPLNGDGFTVVVLRQATVYGLSPRMRFDLAINGMAFGAWKTGKLPLMRDGSQWRPMLHVKDTCRAQMFMLTAPVGKVGGQIFNVGSDRNNYRIGDLGRIVAGLVPKGAEIEWYGEPDHRSYKVDFAKIESLGWKAQYTAEDGVAEIVEALEAGSLDKTDKTITLKWYQELVRWQKIVHEAELDGRMVELP